MILHVPTYEKLPISGTVHPSISGKQQQPVDNACLNNFTDLPPLHTLMKAIAEKQQIKKGAKVTTKCAT
jgi:hypothetical protein